MPNTLQTLKLLTEAKIIPQSRLKTCSAVKTVKIDSMELLAELSKSDLLEGFIPVGNNLYNLCFKPYENIIKSFFDLNGIVEVN